MMNVIVYDRRMKKSWNLFLTPSKLATRSKKYRDSEVDKNFCILFFILIST